MYSSFVKTCIPNTLSDVTIVKDLSSIEKNVSNLQYEKTVEKVE